MQKIYDHSFGNEPDKKASHSETYVHYGMSVQNTQEGIGIQKHQICPHIFRHFDKDWKNIHLVLDK